MKWRKGLIGGILCALGWLSRAQTPEPDAFGPAQIPTWTESDVVFLLDASPTMDVVDAPKRRLEGIRKCLAAFGEHDRVAFLRIANAIETVAPLTPVSDANRPLLETHARNATTTVAVSSGELTRGVREASALLESAGRKDVTRAIILVTSTALPDSALSNRVEFQNILLSILDTLRAAGNTLYVVSVGQGATYGEKWGNLVGKKFHYPVARSEELVAAFSTLLARIQAVYHIEKQNDLPVGQALTEEITVPPQLEYLQLDVYTAPDASGAVPLSLTLTDPDGVVVAPRLRSPEDAFYHLKKPKPGLWKYQATVSRPSQVHQQIVLNSGLQIISYYPSVVLVREKTPLVFGVRAPDGPVKRASFRIGGRFYRIVSAEVTVTDPSGNVRVLSPPERERKRSSPMAGEFVTEWTPSRTGEYTLRTLVRFRRGEGKYLIDDTRKIRVTDNPKEVPLVALRAPEGGVLLPLTDPKTDNTRYVEIIAQVVEAGSVAPSPYMVGRFLEAEVEYSPSLVVQKNDTEPYHLGPERKPLGPQKSGTVRLLTDMTVAGTVQYAFPGRIAPERIYLDRPGYYRVALKPSGAYRLDKTRTSVILRAGSHDKKPELLALLIGGGFLTLVGATFYVLIERGVIGAGAPKEAAVEDKLIETNQLMFVDVLREDAFKVPLVIPYEIALYEGGILVNHTYLEHEALIGANYVVKVIHGETKLNNVPLSESLDIHMMPGDIFTIGKFSARIVGIETPVLVIQFEVQNKGDYQFINAITEESHFRWTLTAPQPERVPPQPGTVLQLDFTKRNDMIIGRDEGFASNRPTDIPLYHSSVGESHARLTKFHFLNGTLGYGIKAINGTIYVGERRVPPGESVEDFPPGTVLGIGKFKMRLTWSMTNSLYPELEILEAPPAEEMPLPSLIGGESTVTLSQEGTKDLDALLGTPSSPEPSTKSPATTPQAISLEGTPSQEETTTETSTLSELFLDEEASTPPAPEEISPSTGESPSVEVSVPEVSSPEVPQVEEAKEEEFSLADLLSASEGDEPEVFQVPEEVDTLESILTPPSPPAVTDANRDPATGWLTPTRTEQELNEEWENARTADIELSFVLIDLERILDRPSSQAILSEVAHLVQEQFEEVATLGRYDNERLLVLLPNVPEAEAYEVAEEIREILSGHFSPTTTQNILYGVAARRANSLLDPDTMIQRLQETMHSEGRPITVYRHG